MNDGTTPLPEPPGGLRSWRRRLVPDEAARPVAVYRDLLGRPVKVYGAAPLKPLHHDNERLAAFASSRRVREAWNEDRPVV